jgi:hypothetical protein
MANNHVSPKSPRLDFQCGQFAPGPHLGKPRPPSATDSAARSATSLSTHDAAQAVLGNVEKLVVELDEASGPRDTKNCHGLASGWLPVVLDWGFEMVARP